MIYILAATKELATIHAGQNALAETEWTFVDKPKDIIALKNSTVRVVDGWARRKCRVQELTLKTQLSVFGAVTSNHIIYTS